MLPRGQVVALRQLATMVGLARDELLRGIEEATRARLPTAHSREAQLLYDLTHLNQLARRDPTPLVTWLGNALHLSGEPGFAEALATLGVEAPEEPEEDVDVTEPAVIHPRLSDLQQEAQRQVTDGSPAAARTALRRVRRLLERRLAHAPDDDYARLVEGFVRKDEAALQPRLGAPDPAARAAMIAEAHALFDRLVATHRSAVEESRRAAFLTAHALLGKGNLELLEGRFREAVSLIERAEKLYPESPSITNDLAIARRAMQR